MVGIESKNITESKRPTPLRPSIGVVVCLISSLVAELGFQIFLVEPELLPFFARISIVFAGLYTVHRFALLGLRNYREELRNFVFLHMVLIGSVVVVVVGRVIAEAVVTYSAEQQLVTGGVAIESLYFAIPFAVGALLVQALLGLHHAFVFSISLALLVGVYMPQPGVFSPIVLVSSLVGSFSLQRFRSRSAYVKAGMNIALVMLPLSLVAVFLHPGETALVDFVVRVVAVFAGGMLCSFIAAGITPIGEHLGGYVTDMRLLEMATLDHPLLKQLSIQAPGTWNHSMVIGMMVEAAADAIGANPVLARVGAYFHDAGKIKKPLYFVENQAGGENRHGKLSTSMSALIIRSHVKDGIELARKHKLPQAIIDMIPQHHGTSIIGYFYDKAREEAGESDEVKEVDISLYTYPGPKPQTREAALLMLADGIEAAARTISEPTLDRIQGMVQKMINKVFASGQLNESEITLKDLHEIAKCFTRVLNGIYHQRVAYAEPAEKVSEKAQAKQTVNEDTEKEGGTENGKDANGKKTKQGVKEENLKRLGLE